jgi:MGT family glycosyltransferase
MNKASLPALNATRASIGVRPFKTADEMFNVAPLLLYMTAEPFEYPRSDWPAAVRMVGPCCWEPPSDSPPWLDEITRPLVLVTTSSEFQDDGRLVRTALDALADEDVQVVATLPAAKLDMHVPANARVETFISHGPLLARAVCAITHGGAGATQKALAAGVPVCVVPFGRDQLEVARRVEVANAGTRLPAQKLNAERLRNQVRLAITKRDGARRIADGFGASGGAHTAADAFEALAAASNTNTRARSRTRLIDARVRRHARSHSVRATRLTRGR